MTATIHASARKLHALTGRYRARAARATLTDGSFLLRGRSRLDDVALRRSARRLRSRAPRPGDLRELGLDELLIGWDGGIPPSTMARRGGSLTRASTLVGEGPHLDLLRRWTAEGDAVLEPDVLWRSAYGHNARQVMTLGGDYFGATTPEHLARVARSFVARAMGEQHEQLPGQSGAASPVRVRPVRWSDVYQVVDGHHRAAIEAWRGRRQLTVRVERPAVSTPLQQHLLAMSWIGGRRELYQPVPMPDVSTWTLVRRCTDRMAMMKQFLADAGIGGRGSSYLDVASCYGWFVQEFAALGADANGIELDPLGKSLGEAVYGLAPHAVRTGDAMSLLGRGDRRYTVVSCFSLVHHFWLGRSTASAEDLLRVLDRATDQVLFLDAGQATERWFSRTLRGWTPEAIERWLREVTTFDDVVALGVDQDDRPPFSGNYGRTLFACTRRR